jgi:replication factor A1
LKDEQWQILSGVEVKTVFSCKVRQLAAATLNCESLPQISDEKYATAADDLEKKVSELKAGSTPIVVNVMVLSRPVVEEITTKEGEMVRKAEVLVGDDTDDVKLVAWRDQTTLIENVKLGQRMQIRGVIAKNSINDTLSLQTRSYTQIIIK